MSARFHASSVAAVSAIVASLSAPGAARAASTIRDPNPPRYSIEIEPHLNLQGFPDGGGTFGFGAGARFSIPLASPGFIGSINDSIAITFGGDFVRFTSSAQVCGATDCVAGPSFWALYAPVALQWNFFLTEQWSVFGEPGIALRHAFLDHCFDCSSNDVVRPMFDVGARYALADGAKLTMRFGYPLLASVGISFL